VIAKAFIQSSFTEAPRESQAGLHSPFETSPQVPSEPFGWHGVKLQRYSLDQLKLDHHRWNRLSLLFFLTPIDSLLFQTREGWEVCHVTEGQVSLHPAGSTCTLNTSNPAQVALIEFTPAFLAQTIHQVEALSSVQLPTLAPHTDLLVLGTLRRLLAMAEATHPEGGSRYAESICKSLIVHLLSYHGKEGISEMDVRPGLSPNQLKKAIQAVQGGLENKVTVEQMAKASGLTKYHFSRQFKQSMGMSPSRYLMNQRAELAKNLLMDPSLGIAEVSRRAGYSDQSHLTLDFRKHFGITPKRFRSSLIHRSVKTPSPTYQQTNQSNL